VYKVSLQTHGLAWSKERREILLCFAAVCSTCVCEFLYLIFDCRVHSVNKVRNLIARVCYNMSCPWLFPIFPDLSLISKFYVPESKFRGRHVCCDFTGISMSRKVQKKKRRSVLRQ
jgi:hypothetical protein